MTYEEKLVLEQNRGRYIYKSGKSGNKTFVIAPTDGKEPYEDYDCTFVVENGTVRSMRIPEELSEVGEVLSDDD